jgi:hypothetical protein
MKTAKRLVYTSRRLTLRSAASPIRLWIDNDLALHTELVVKSTEVLVRAW